MFSLSPRFSYFLISLDHRLACRMLGKTPSRVTDITDVFDSLSLSSKVPLNSEWTDRDRTKTPTSHIGFGPRKDSRALKIRNITPSRNGDFKGVTDGDRYIAQHDQDQLDFARFKMTEVCFFFIKSRFFIYF